ncbi:M48 family metalloprotease [Actinoplanes sp. LDG1-06]|uniref:M48 family metalloprotease n=1 Tax=Paractinoplanes ovalisporus TaxID=2810368 RepID=A0ABS2AAA1_9ACTN|nr:M48 family metalloprotease [Actinoplanes ovalisporus]MBM2616268.1 M48 family metalloprotease [Actinoplanes ovalisporus]
MTAAAVRRPPSATRGRYLLIMVLLLLGGALAGQLTHHLTVGLNWRDVTEACFRDAYSRWPAAEDALRRAPVINACRAGVEHRFALFAAGGALLMLAGAAFFAWLLPRVLLLRLGPRRPAPFEGWAAQLGVRRAPEVEFGPWGLREPFTVRAWGATRVVLPPGVRRLPAAHLDAVLRHETAHVAAGDVTLVWLTRGLLWALPLVMLVPPVLAGFDDGGFWLRYGLRAALLGAAAYLLARAVMRDRELEADRHAALAGSSDALIELLGAARGGRRHLLSMHPSPAERVAALREPGRLLGMPASVAAVAGALAVNIWSAGAGIGLSAFLGTPLEPYPQLVAGLFAGALLAATWGLAVWRRPPRAVTSGPGVGRRPPRAVTSGPVLGRRLPRAVTSGLGIGRRPPWAGATLGLLLGVAAGLLVNLDPRTLAGDWRIDWWAVLYVPVAVAGAAGCVLALATIRAPRWWPAGFVLGAAVFAGALWIGAGLAVQQPVAVAATDRPALVAVLWTAGFGSAWLTAAPIALLALAVFTFSRTALLGGLVVGLVAVVGRWLVPLPALDAYGEAQRDWWAAALAGFAVVVVMLVWRGASGLAAALVAAPAAALTVSAGVLLRYMTDWDEPLAAARVYLTRPLTMVAVLILAVGAAAGLLPSRPGRGPRSRPGRGPRRKDWFAWPRLRRYRLARAADETGRPGSGVIGEAGVPGPPPG